MIKIYVYNFIIQHKDKLINIIYMKIIDFLHMGKYKIHGNMKHSSRHFHSSYSTIRAGTSVMTVSFFEIFLQ